MSGTTPRIQEIHVKSSSFLRSFSRIQTFTAQHHLRGRDLSGQIFFKINPWPEVKPILGTIPFSNYLFGGDSRLRSLQIAYRDDDLQRTFWVIKHMQRIEATKKIRAVVFWIFLCEINGFGSDFKKELLVELPLQRELRSRSWLLFVAWEHSWLPKNWFPTVRRKNSEMFFVVANLW